MTLTDILNALNAASAGGSLDLYGVNPSPDWPLKNLINAANKFGPSPAVSLVDAIVTQQTAASVVLTGRATLTVPGAPAANTVAMSVTLTATLPTPDEAVFRLALTPSAATWTFGTQFPNLPQSQIAIDGGVSWQASFMTPLAARAPVFTADSIESPVAAVLLSGSLPLADNGVLEGLTGWLGVQPLALSGSIVMPQTADDQPAMNLSARLSGAQIKVGTMTVQDMSLSLQSQIDLDPALLGVTSQTLLSLSATLTIGAGPNAVLATLSSPLLQGDHVWPLYLSFDVNKPTLSGGLLMLMGLFDGMTPNQFPLPSSLPVLDDFTFENISVGLVPPTAEHPFGGLSFVAVTLGSDYTWTPPVPFVRIRNVGTRWVLTFGGDPYAYSLDQAVIAGTVYGDVVIGGAHAQTLPRYAGLRKTAELATPDETNSFTISVNALIPQYVVTGQLADDDTIPLNSALEYFFGGAGPDGPFKDVAITAFNFYADPSSQTYQAGATVTTNVTVPLGQAAVTLDKLEFWVDVTQSVVSGGLSGFFVLEGGGPDDQADPTFVLAAEYSGATVNAGWTFSGRLYPGMSVDLTKLTAKFLSADVPAWVPHIYIDSLAFSFNTTAENYQLAGSASVKWPAPVLGIEGGVAVTAHADIARSAGGVVTGTLGGAFQIGKIGVALETDIGVEEQIYRFIATFDKLILTVTTGQRTSKGATKPHQVLYARLGGVTLGAILEYLVNLAAPTIGYKLDSPWDLLNKIDLSRFQLMFDPTDNIVELTCDVGADIVVMRIDSIGVRYWKPSGKSTVELILEGNFLGKSYRGDDALAWDVVDDPPPAVPGQGNSLIDIRYLGLGQRVSFADDVFNALDTVRGFLNELTTQMGPVADPNVNPLTQNPGMAFSADSQWLIGFDITLLDTVDLGFLFNDPKLYGLSISLHGEKAKSFAGLNFEILYKKISDTVGMFRIELRLPDKFRHFEMGEVSVTLGIIVVEIYTNGNFLIDMGFPYNRNFDRSFAVEVFPFLGRGGFYFGVLDGTTSRRTPKITNGTFAPVIEVGLGLAVGVGKDITFGPLSGGAYLQVEATFQGVLAWFNPSDASAASDEYYWMQAIVAIHGRIYGQVDFVIVKASANIEAYAEASVILEAYRAALFRLNARVRVSASVRVLFIKINFSFSAEIDVSFTVGSNSRTPWILASSQGGAALPGARRTTALRTGALARQHLTALASRRAAPEARVMALHAALTGNPGYVLDWDPSTVVFDVKKTAPLCLAASGSVSGLPAAWSGAQAPALPAQPNYRLAFVATAADGRNAADGGSQAVKSAVRSALNSAQATDTSDLPIDVLMEALLRWSISAVVGDAAAISAGQLAILADQITWSDTTDAFSLSNLAAFFSNNIILQIAGPPADGQWPSAYSASVAPMPPFLSWTSTQLPNRDFNTYNPVGPLYEWGADQYFTQFQTTGGDPGPAPDGDDPATYESVAAFVYRDWCLMLARTAVQAAVDALKASSFQLTSALSLAEVAKQLPTASVEFKVGAGDTVGSVAAALGATEAELTFHNPGLANALKTAAPGAIMDIVIGAAPGEIAADNPNFQLVPGVSVSLNDIDYQIPADATFAGVAALFGLPDAAALFTDTTLIANTTVLRAGAVFPTQTASYANPQNFVLKFTAAVFYVRFANRTQATGGDVLAETIFQLNSATGQALADWKGTIDLPVGAVLTMPAAYAGMSTTSATYATLPGDTLARLGAALALASGADAADPDWLNFLAAVQGANPQWTAGAVAIPALPIAGGLNGVAIALGESVAALAARTIIFAGAPAGLLAWIGDQPILAPLAVLTVPTAPFTTATTPPDTFLGLATRYGMTANEFGALKGVADNAALLYAEGQDAEIPSVLAILHLPAQNVDTLVADVMKGAAPGQAAGLTARQLLAGQSLPAPQTNAKGHVEASGPLTPLYDLTGQQTPSPAPDAANPNATAVALTVTVDPAYQSWVVLTTTATVQTGQTLAELQAAHPQINRLNPGLAAAGRFASGLMVLTDEVAELPIQFTNSQLAAMYPETGLLLSPTRGPKAMPMSTLSPRPYGLDHQIPVQAPDGFAFTPAGEAPLKGGWSLWPFPDELLARAQTGSSTLYEVVQRYTDTSRPQADDIVGNATWATAVSFQIRRMSGFQDVFEVIGADAADRQLLLETWRSLSDGAYGYLLYAPAPSNDDTAGTMAAQPDPAKTYLVKTNLSTETTSGAQNAVRLAEVPPEDVSDYYANFGSLKEFLTLLWEASVVGGYGYTFSYQNIHGAGLPDSCFNQSGVAVLSLMVLDASQLAPAPSGRTLLKTNNYALVAPGLNASTNALYVLSADDTDDIDMPAYPAGNIGFTVTLPKADADSAASAQDLLAAQFSLVSYNVASCPNTPYTPTSPAPPISPQEEDGTHQSSARRQRAARRVRAGLATATAAADAAYWRYDQVLPIYRFGPASAAPPVVGLPIPADDPYRGPGAAGTMVPARIQMDAIDVFGNVTTPANDGGAGGDANSGAPPGAVDYTLGYYDPLITPSSWPATTLAYGLTTANGKVRLTVSLAPQPAALAPNPLQSAASLAAKAALQAGKYQEIYFQLAQAGVVPKILSTLQISGQAPAALDVDRPEFALRYAAASYAYANALSSSLPVKVNVATANNLSQVWEQYGTGPYLAAAANKAALIYQVFGPQTLKTPTGAAFAEGDTPQSIVDAAKARSRQGWPAPADAASLLTAEPNAAVLLLRAKTVLALPAGSTFTVPGDAPSLGALATDMRTTPGLLASDIAAQTTNPPAFAADFKFEYEGFSVVTGPTLTTFDQVVAAFAAQGVICTASDLAELNQEKPGLFAAGTILPTAHIVASDDETLTQAAQTAFTQPLSPALTLQTLAQANTLTKNLYDSGALVYLGEMAVALTGAETRTVAEFADAYGTTPGLLLADNATASLPADTALTVPGAIQAPVAAQRVPFAISAGDTLSGAAGAFAATAQDLADANAAMPYVVAGGQTLHIKTATVTTQAGWSLNALWDAAMAQDDSVTFADTVSAIASNAQVLQDGGLLICPPATIPTSGGNLTTTAAAQLYHLDGMAFAQANAGTAGLIAANVTLTAPGATATIATTTAYDTFNSIVARFADAGQALSLADILAANPDARLIAAGAAAYLPPPVSRLTATMPANAGPFPAPVFPLSVWLRIQRPAAAIPVELDPTGGVARVDTVVPAPTAPQGAEGESSETFTAFSADFAAALPLLRLATGKVEGQTADLWAVDFGASGIKSVAVAPPLSWEQGAMPRVWALRPLYNSLQTRMQVEVRTVQADGALSAPAFLNFQNVDPESWAARLLSDIDVFLSGAYAAALYADNAGRQRLLSVIEAKKTLAAAIARGLYPVLALATPAPAAAATQARALIADKLAASLSSSYAMTALLQYDAATTSAWTSGQTSAPPARLSGAAKPQAPAPADPRPYTLTGAKTDVSVKSSYVSFVMTTPNVQTSSHIPVNLGYFYDEAEFDIQAVPNVEGYVSSNWLSFLPSLEENPPAALSTDLGSSEIPAPLRAYPPLPALAAQSSAPTYPQPASLDQTHAWTFGLTYSHQHAEQDEIIIGLDFNIEQTLMAARLAAPDNIVDALAAYAVAADALWALLPGWVDKTRGVSLAVRQNAAASFATLASAAAAAWDGHWPSDAGESANNLARVAASPTSAYQYYAQVGYEGEGLKTYTLTSVGASGVSPSGKWPDVYYTPPGGAPQKMTYVNSPTPVTAVYNFPTPPLGAGLYQMAAAQTIGLAWSDLELAALQNAKTNLAVRRNAKLLGETGPDTNDDFIYHTPDVAAESSIWPLLNWPQRFIIGKGAQSGFAAALQTALTSVLGAPNGQNITLSVDYGVELKLPTAQAPDGLITYLPVRLYPHVAFSATTAADLAAELQIWLTAHQPESEHGEWAVSLTMYAASGEASSMSQPGRPLLAMDKLIYQLANGASTD